MSRCPVPAGALPAGAPVLLRLAAVRPVPGARWCHGSHATVPGCLVAFAVAFAAALLLAVAQQNRFALLLLCVCHAVALILRLLLMFLLLLLVHVWGLRWYNKIILFQ